MDTQEDDTVKQDTLFDKFVGLDPFSSLALGCAFWAFVLLPIKFFATR